MNSTLTSIAVANIPQLAVIEQPELPVFLARYMMGEGCETFIREIVKEWTQHTFESDIACNQIKTQCIWHNSHIRINNQLLFNKVWYDCGVLNINDLLIADIFLEFEPFFRQNMKFNFLEYYSLLHAIPDEWKKKTQGQ